MSPKIHWDVEQGSDTWDAMRAGKWGSSSAAVIMGGLDTSGLDSLVKDVSWGRVYGPIESGFKSAAMERGHLVEPEARDWYAFERSCAVEQAGLVEHATVPHVIWSPDGLIKPNGGIEAKSPLHRNYMECKRTGKIPAAYRWQCRWAMWVGQLDFLDFVCYHDKAGGIIISSEITESEKDQMEKRVVLLETRVAEWIGILQNRNLA